MLVGMFRIHLQQSFGHMLTFIRHIEVYFTFAFLDCVRYNEDFVTYSFVISRFGRAEENGSLYRGFRYIEVREVEVQLSMMIYVTKCCPPVQNSPICRLCCLCFAGKDAQSIQTILQENLNVAGEWFSRLDQIAVKLYKNQSNAVLLLNLLLM